MKNEFTTKLKYDGPILQIEGLETGELIKVLEGMTTLIERSDSIINNGNTYVVTQVKNIEKGSYSVTFILQQVAKDSLNFLGSSEVAGLGTIVSLLGGGGLLDFIKTFIRGRKIVRTVDHNGIVEIVLENGESIKVNSEIQLLYSDASIKESIEKIVSPLHKSGIEQLDFFKGDTPILKITKDEAIFFKPDYGIVEIHESLSQELVFLDSISFNKGKWKVTSRGKSFKVSMKDPNYINQINSKTIGFVKGDQLLVLLKTIKKTTSEFIKVEYEVMKVIEHKSEHEQSYFE